MKPKQIHIVFTSLILAIIGLVALFSLTTKSEFGETAPSSLDQLGGNFTLQSLQGDVSLSDFKGKAVVMYFGFMSCPEVCPNSLGVIKAAFNKLDEDTIADVQGIMISIDPKRDSLQSLEAFTQHFHPNITGITGDEKILEKTAKQYGAYFSKTDDPKLGYLYEHVSRYYVIDKDGELVDAMRHSTTPNELVARLKTII